MFESVLVYQYGVHTGKRQMALKPCILTNHLL